MNGSNSSNGPKLAFLWESLGPSHHDRLQAVAAAGHRVTAIELFERSRVYDWEDGPDPAGYDVVSLARDRRSISTLGLARRIVAAAQGAEIAFLCHYNEPAVFLAARKLSAMGVQVLTMIDSKADDRARGPILQWLKRIMLSPYGGALVAGKRSADYVRSLGVSADRIALHYNTLDIGALRNLAKHVETLAFASRPFLVVARLIPEKNLAAALEAFAAYRNAGGKRVLAIIGEGPEEERLRALADDLGLAGLIEWRGSHSRGDVAVAMRRALALLLPSTSETYGFVVIEALAQGLPVIVSERAGVVDLPIINGVEGRVIDPANVAQICAAMQAIDSSEEEWRAWSDAASAAAGRAQTHHFVASVEGLAGLEQG